MNAEVKNEMNIDVKNIGDFLKSHGIRPSYPRVKIYEYLIRHKNHPTVDMIYNSLADVIPSLSKTTVYNTLNMFVDKNVAIVLEMNDSEARYDADVSLHGHFRCVKCGSIYDFNLDSSDFRPRGLDNFLVSEVQVTCKGICAGCRT